MVSLYSGILYLGRTMGRYPERDLERVGGGADQARDGYGSHLPQD